MIKMYLYTQRPKQSKICLKPRWWNGIHTSLKNLWEQSHEGSTPSLGTFDPVAQLDRATAF